MTIHHLRHTWRRLMDQRAKPAGDGKFCGAVADYLQGTDMLAQTDFTTELPLPA
jgi:hypothetical protein